MIKKELQFGNPWHGKLGVGTLDMAGGSPVSSITLDGVTHTVKGVAGNLGDTRYIKAPGLPVPTTPASIFGKGGAFMNDAILYSDEFRYSPLSTKKVLNNKYEWLLWDSTAAGWRRMALEFTWSSMSASPSNGANCVQIRLYRGGVIGRLNTVLPSAPTSEYTHLSSQYLTYSFKYDPRRPAFPYGYNPDFRVLNLTASPDGRKIAIYLEALRRSGFFPATTINSWPVDSSGQSKAIYDVTKEHIFAVWEVEFSADGSSASAATAKWPGDIADPTARWDFFAQVTGAAYSSPAGSGLYAWYVPTILTQRNYLRAVATSAFSNVGYDKNGTLHLMCFEETADLINSYILTGYAYLGTSLSDSTPPSYSISSDVHEQASQPTADEIRAKYPGVVSFSGDNSTAQAVTHLLSISDNGVNLCTWNAPFGDPLRFKWKTNNVSHVEVGSVSKVRIAPGVVDATNYSGTFYSSFNPRLAQLISANDPVGWV